MHSQSVSAIGHQFWRAGLSLVGSIRMDLSFNDRGYVALSKYQLAYTRQILLRRLKPNK